MNWFEVSSRHARQLLGLRRSTYCYRSRARDRTALKMPLRDLAMSRIRFGYGMPGCIEHQASRI
jgi:hypothetical protein